MGHYAFVTGYDEPKQLIIYQDTYQPQGAPPGPNRQIKYSTFIEGWRAFNYVFVVVYPDEKENEVLTLLGPLADEKQASLHALSVAQTEAQTLADIDRFFAWFNVGTSHIALLQYADAAIAYDYAFSIYADLDVNDSVRPYRMMWYQTGPYKAYFYTNRFADVINLADTTLNDTIAEPVLEESLYWRGRAYYMAGKTDLAVKDYRAALGVHPQWIPPQACRIWECSRRIMKILHFADAHIDMANYGRHDPETGLPLRVLDFLKSLDTIIDAAVSEKVDMVIFAGDAYKDRAPAPTFQREWGKRIIRLSQAKIPTLLLVGNHDLSPALGRAPFRSLILYSSFWRCCTDLNSLDPQTYGISPFKLLPCRGSHVQV
jgi:tetratricopeptide (TPR) repeat protein